MRFSIPLCLLALLSPIHTVAASESEAARQAPLDAAILETVVVSGEQPGPGLWKVSKDDHVLWILGTLTPVPKKMSWVSRDVEATIAQSQEVLLHPNVNMSVDGGMLRGIFLLPALLGARNNPDKEKLVDVVPADLYARWLVLRQKYAGNDRSLEKRRPMFAAQTLYEKAIARSGLSLDSVVEPVVKKAAKKHSVPVTRPVIELKVAEPGSAVREFAKSSLDDIECFRKTIERVESDVETMKARGNAWATGDVQALIELPVTDQNPACRDAFFQARVMQERGMGDMQERVAKVWLAAAETALTKNRVSFATLPMTQVLNPDGYVATLKSRGYSVEEPWASDSIDDR